MKNNKNNFGLVNTSTILKSINIYQLDNPSTPLFFSTNGIRTHERWTRILSNKLRRFIKGSFKPKNAFWIPERLLIDSTVESSSKTVGKDEKNSINNESSELIPTFESFTGRDVKSDDNLRLMKNDRIDSFFETHLSENSCFL